MKKSIILGSLLVIALATVSLAQSPLPKEGSGAMTVAYTGTLKTLALGTDHVRIAYEVFGVATNDAGQGFFHNTSGRCIGGLDVVKGEFDNEAGACLWVDRDGDQVFLRYAGAGRAGVPAKLKFTYTGGTGKYAGLTGGGETTRTPLRPTMEGTTYSHTKGTYTYKLP